MAYYATFVVIFQFGWASTQISHLAAIPDLSICQNERTGLTAIRFGMTVISTILVRINQTLKHVLQFFKDIAEFKKSTISHLIGCFFDVYFFNRSTQLHGTSFMVKPDQLIKRTHMLSHT